MKSSSNGNNTSNKTTTPVAKVAAAIKASATKAKLAISLTSLSHVALSLLHKAPIDSATTGEVTS